AVRKSVCGVAASRARAVPFCPQGFLPEPETSARFLVMCVPRRAPARCCLTASYTRWLAGLAANTTGESWISRTVSPVADTTFTFGDAGRAPAALGAALGSALGSALGAASAFGLASALGFGGGVW